MRLDQLAKRYNLDFRLINEKAFRTRTTPKIDEDTNDRSPIRPDPCHESACLRRFCKRSWIA